MDIKFQTTITYKHVLTALKYYFIYVYTPAIIRNLIGFVFTVWLLFYYFSAYFELMSIFLCAMLIFCVIVPVVKCYRLLKKIKKDFQTRWQDCMVSDFHLTDTTIESVNGKNSSRAEYRLFTYYFEYKNHIFLLSNKSMAYAFEIDELQGAQLEFIQCLQNAGVKKLKFYSFQQWHYVFGMLIFIISIMSFVVWIRVSPQPLMSHMSIDITDFSAKVPENALKIDYTG